MKRTKYTSTLVAFALCFSLLMNALPHGAHANSSRIEETFDLGEIVEAPADATAYVSLGEAGSCILASGAKAKLATYANGSNPNARTTLVASVIEGDVIVRLEPQARALVKAGNSIFSPGKGSLFHAGIKDGAPFLSELGDWGIKIPMSVLLPDLGNWTLQTPLASFLKLPELRAEASAPVFALPKTRQLNFSASAQAIGRIESVGAIKINQLSVARQSLLWGSELIQAPDDASARALFDGLAQVTLTSGSQARLMTPTVGGVNGSRVLSASLISGDLTVQLDASTAGYAEVAGSTFLAARGSRFRAMLVEGHAVFEVVEGAGFEKGDWSMALPQADSDLLKIITQTPTQQPLQAGQRRYLVRPVGLNSNLVVRARSTRQIQVRVTDEDDRPVNGVPIIFSLGSQSGSSIGTLGAVGAAASGSNDRVFTDAQGVATVSFTAADVPTTGSITATVEGTNYSWVGQINLIKVTVGFWSPQNAVPVLVTAGAAAAIGTIKAATKDDKVPIQPIGSTIIKP